MTEILVKNLDAALADLEQVVGLAKSHVSSYTRKDGRFVASHEDKRQKKSKDDISDIFSVDWFAGAEEQAAKDKAQKDNVLGLLDESASKEASKSSEFANKVYKDNSKVVDFGDTYHPYSNKETMSIGAINESKRKKRVSLHAKNAQKLKELIADIKSGKISVAHMKKEIDRFEELASGDSVSIPKGMSKGDYVEYLFASSTLKQDPATFGKNSLSHRVIEIIKKS